MERCKLKKRGMLCIFWITNKNNREGYCKMGNEGCEQIVEACEGCSRIYIPKESEERYCLSYASPRSVWRHSNTGHCPLATHMVVVSDNKRDKVVNPLKAAKRQRSGK